ncbi:MAG: DUF1385 domain-containing protein [Clostridia bacterium]|nr:DUF1385 domain-containing protein [Clostridia bacterium]
MANKKTSIGGQALMEGIMMRGPEMTAMAVRRADGEIVMEEFPTNNSVPKICKLPLIRGVYGMVTSMAVGYKCMMRSADLYADDLITEEEAKEAAKAAEKQTADGSDSPEGATATETVAESTSDTTAPAEKAEKAEKKESKKADKKDKKDNKEEEGVFGTAAMIITVVLAVALMLGLFFWLPTFLYDLTVAKLTTDLSPILARFIRSLTEAMVRVLLLVGYMLAISQMKEIKRTFMFHGAEHKTIFCYEQGLPLTVENVRPMRRFHPRCGTSFLILMVLVGILLGLLIPFTGWLRVVCKIALIPFTVGIGYELIKLAGRYDNFFTRMISAPGVWLQHITTKEPDDAMIECAIAAMERVIPEDQEKDNW